MATLNSPIEQINRVAKKITPKMKKLGLLTVADLLKYWPFRWEDWSQIKKINKIEPNTRATVKVKVELIQNKRSKYRKKMITEAILSDDSDSIRAIWFNQPYLTKNIKVGDYLFISGKVEMSHEGTQFIHPQYEKISSYANEPTHTARVVPIYPLTKGVTNKQLRYVIKSVIGLVKNIKDWLPEDVVYKYKLMPLPKAVYNMHFPQDIATKNIALERIKFNELFLIQLRSILTKQQLKKLKAPKIEFQKKATAQFVKSLLFNLTNAQKIASWEILQDINKQTPMNRLLEGDVGSGKTVVSAIAILNTAKNKKQIAYMAPTEVLAHQHFHSLSQLFNKWPLKIGLLTSALKKTNQSDSATIGKKQIYKKISSGELDLIIGTHALIQEGVEFKDLALTIVDEQHRFGVEQRKKLKHKNKSNLIPHLLSMTATPIPRSLALSVYGDLDLSIIDEMPEGRKKIITEIVPPEKKSDKYKFILDKIKEGQQIFIICPLIDPSDKLGVKAVSEEYEKLDKKIFPNVEIGLMHGKLKTKQKEQVMRDFLDKKTKILVSTPVIEVGVDVANASIMLIESAERFGLAQLHQFRGRVGRGEHQSYCFLMTESADSNVIKRLQILVKTSDGFKIAEADLEFRGPGEVYGIKQSGFKDELKVAKLTDYMIIKKAKKSAEVVVQYDPSLAKFPQLRKKIEQFESQLHLE